MIVQRPLYTRIALAKSGEIKLPRLSSSSRDVYLHAKGLESGGNLFRRDGRPLSPSPLCADKNHCPHSSPMGNPATGIRQLTWLLPHHLNDKNWGKEGARVLIYSEIFNIKCVFDTEKCTFSLKSIKMIQES